MLRILLFSLSLSLFACNVQNQSSEKEGAASAATKQASSTPPAYAIAIHGGAGTIRKSRMTEERAEAIQSAMNQALDAGQAVLAAGGTAADAVEKTIWVLEDSPYFNAGKGAVFTNAGINEMDASFMTGEDLLAGAVGGITNVKHPISAARAVKEKSEHVLLSGKGAEQFAKEQGLEIVPAAYFYTEERYQSLERIKAREGVKTKEAVEAKDQHGSLLISREIDEKFGTVGCVALDQYGNIAAGTSTGGMTNKRYNRIGDSPIIGAGTYANNASCAVSCTGHGEFFIRHAVAFDVHARMIYGGQDLQTAAHAVIHDVLKPVGGEGGLIAIDAKGNIAMPFNSEGMYRGYQKAGEARVIRFYEDED